MFDGIANKIQDAFRKLAGKSHISEKNIQDGIHEVKMALFQADVNYKVVNQFIENVTKKAVGQDVLKSVSPAQQFIKIVNDELIALMGQQDSSIKTVTNGTSIIMMVGLQGSGKTTTTAKLAKYLVKKGHKPIMVAADMIRPAAVTQLITLGKQNNVEVFSEQARPVKVCEDGVRHAREKGFDFAILDTQGRLHINEEMMKELREIRDRVKPENILLVVDSMTGQDAVNSASKFNTELNIDGVILTKLDGDARGGAAMSIRAVTGKPIKFVGIGEKVETLDEFYPDRMASRILGMGDIVTLVEKAQSVMDEKEAEKLREKFLSAEFTIDDFYKQIQGVKKMGPLKDLIKMMPGLNQMVSEDSIKEDEMIHIEAIIQSMTPQERFNPELLSNVSRRQRIAKGSGRPLNEVSSFLKQFDKTRQIMKDLKRGRNKSDVLKNIMKDFKLK